MKGSDILSKNMKNYRRNITKMKGVILGQYLYLKTATKNQLFSKGHVQTLNPDT